MVGLHTKWHYEQHSVDEIYIALDRTQKKEDNLSIVFFGAVRRGLEPLTPCVTGTYSNQLY